MVSNKVNNHIDSHECLKEDLVKTMYERDIIKAILDTPNYGHCNLSSLPLWMAFILSRRDMPSSRYYRLPHKDY